MALADREYADKKPKEGSEEAIEVEGEVITVYPLFPAKVFCGLGIILVALSLAGWGLLKTGLLETFVSFWWLFALLACFWGYLCRRSLKEQPKSVLLAGTMLVVFLLYGTLVPFIFSLSIEHFLWLTPLVAALAFIALGVTGMFRNFDVLHLRSLFFTTLLGVVLVPVVGFQLSKFTLVGWEYLFPAFLGLALFQTLAFCHLDLIRKKGEEVEKSQEKSFEVLVEVAYQVLFSTLMIYSHIFNKLFKEKKEVNHSN